VKQGIAATESAGFCLRELKRLFIASQYIRESEWNLPMLKILFLCTGNSCRSQMAEGWARALRGSELDAYSAGVEPHGMNARAVKVMAEAGVDISRHHSKHLDELKDVPLDYVITVCGRAHESCPVFPGHTRVIHVGFDDPPALAKTARTEEEALGHYRRVRDEIRGFIEHIDEYLSPPAGPTKDLRK
jgi:arsenate reductase